MSTVSLRPMSMARRAADTTAASFARAPSALSRKTRVSAASLSRVASTTARRLVRASCRAATVWAFMGSVHLLDEDLDLAAARKADVPGLLVGDAEIQQTRLAVGCIEGAVGQGGVGS